MTLSTHIFNQPFDFDETKANVLIIENKDFFVNSILSFISMSNSKECEYYFFDGNKEITKNIETITNFFDLDINSSKNLTKLYNSIKNDYIVGDHFEEYMKLSESSNKFLNHIMETYEYGIEFNPSFDLSVFLKSCGVKFTFDSNTLIDQIIDYIKIMSEFIGIKIFILVNLKSYLSSEQMRMLYHEFILHKIDVLYLENLYSSDLSDIENIVIIDQDLCVLN